MADEGVKEALKEVLNESNAPLLARVSALEEALKKEQADVHNMVHDSQTKVAQQLRSISLTVDELKEEVGGSGVRAQPSSNHERRDTGTSSSRSMSRSMSRRGADTDTVLDPVTVGDYIVLKDVSAGTSGFVMGVQSASRVGVQQEVFQDAINFDDYVYRIVPMLNYRQRNELEALREARIRRGSSRGRSMSRTTSSEGGERDAENLLYSRVEQEESQNDSWLSQVVSGEFKDIVKYAAVVQIQHVKSGLFLTVEEGAAPLDPDCRSVVLAPGSSAAYFKFMPRFKAQTEGSIVYFTHSLVLESVKQEGLFLHTSPMPYDPLPEQTNPALPKCLQCGKVFESNISPQYSTFSIHKYARFNEEEWKCMRTGVGFRLYHSQSESFIHASCDPQKDSAPAKRTMELPNHIPYLKTLVDKGDDPDPTNPFNHSSKGVWTFEALTRKSGSVVPWDKPCRVRHVPSGRYLAVDTNDTFKHPAAQQEEWYTAYLVDDAFGEDGEVLAGVSQLVPAESMVFHVSSADKTSDQSIPNADCAIRLEHRFIDANGAPRTLYLHNCDVAKPPVEGAPERSSVIIKSFHLVFSSVKSAQDIFKLMVLSDREQQIIDQVKSLLVPVNLYTHTIANPDLKLPDDFKAVVALMFTIIDLQSRGSAEHENTDWIQKANSMLPAAFSKLFGGDPDTVVQRICKDMKLMDSVFNMGCAAYNRTCPVNPWKNNPAMSGPKGVQKFVHVALQRMCFRNPEVQDYFGRRRGLVLSGEARSSERKMWMDTILDQLEDPLGPAVTLAALLSANERLLSKYANAKLVLRFAEMVQLLGPQPRLVNFWEAICTVEGRAVKSNQEMILRLVWMRPEMREKVMLQLHTIPREELKVEDYPPVRLPSGSMTDGKVPRKAIKNFPADYIGKPVFEREGGFDPVYVEWSGADKWGQGNDALFWSPEAMNCRSVKYKDKTLVRLEDFTWVLNAPELCEPIMGMPWEEYEKNMQDEPELKSKFQRQHQLASYFVGQLALHAKMCFGRSYNCISWLEKSFDYLLLTSMCYNVHLPQLVRAASCDFVRTLYLDRYPQLHNCGRPSLPEQLWVFEVVTAGVDVNAIPLIRPLVLKEEGSLPGFKITPSHKLAKDPNPFYSFSTGFKFFLLRNLGNKYMEGFGSGTMVHGTKEENNLAGSVCSIITDLMSFGFQSNLKKVQELSTVLVKVLDGRSDVEKLDLGEHVPFEPPKKRYEISSTSPSVTTVKITILKVLMDIANLRANFRLGKILQTFKEYTQDKRMSLELKKFFVCFESDKEDRYDGPLTDKLFETFEELFVKGDGFALMFENLTGQDVNTILLDLLMYEDDELFAHALAILDRTFGQRRKILDAISQVILLHRSDMPVFGNVADMSSELSFLIFLTRSFSVWGVCSRVSGPFGPDKYEQVISTCDRLLEFLFTPPVEVPPPENAQVRKKRTASAWRDNRAVRLSATAGGEEFAYETGKALQMADMSGTSNALRQSAGDALEEAEGELEGPFELHQNVLRAMNVQSTLIESLNIDYNIAFKGSICSSEEKIKSREYLVDVQRKLIAVLIEFVRTNPENQKIVFAHLPALRKHLGPLKLPDVWPEDFDDSYKAQMPTAPGMNGEEVIIECLRGNHYLCSEVAPRDLFETFGALLNAVPDPSTSNLLEFFEIICVPGDKAIARNQEYAVDVLLSGNLEHVHNCVASIFGIGDLCAQPERVASLLCAVICQGNVVTASRMQTNKLTMDANLSVLQTIMDDVAKKTSDEHEQAELLAENKYFTSMLELLSLQMNVLVIDPRLYRRDVAWQLVCFGVHRLLIVISGKIRQSRKLTRSIEDDLALCMACLRISRLLITGSRGLGLQEKESQYDKELRHGKNAIINSAFTIFSSAIAKSNAAMQSAAESLVKAIDPTRMPVEEPTALSAKRRDSMADPAALAEELLEEERLDFSGVQLYRSPAEMLEMFTEALKNNPRIKKKLQMRRFQFVDTMEHAEDTTDPEKVDTSNSGGGLAAIASAVGLSDNTNAHPYAVKVTWAAITDRMVRYLKTHNFDSDESNCIRILTAFRYSIVKSRCTADGAERDLTDLSEEELEAYKNKQTFLDDHGVTECVLTAIATHTPNVEGNLADEAIELLMEMLNAGNVAVQESVFQYVAKKDKDLKLFHHFRARLRNSWVVIKERKERVVNEFEKMTEQLRLEFENASQTFEVLQQLCEGHNIKLQNLLREQEMHQGDVNLTEDCVNLFALQVQNSTQLRRMEEAEVSLLCSNLDMLVEIVQGPCHRNQDLIVKHDSCVASLDKILQSNFHPRINKGLRLTVKAKAVLLLASCLEGRPDKVVHKKLARELEPAMFEIFQGYVHRFIAQTRVEFTLDDEERDRRLQEALESMVGVQRITHELCLVEEYNTKHHVVIHAAGRKRPELEDSVAVVEVSWDSRVESVSFPLPKEVQYFSETSKESFLNTCELSTAEKRMKQLFKASPGFIAEMKQVYLLAQKSAPYRFVHRNLTNIKWCMYALVVLLNLNIVMASYGEDKDEGYVSAAKGAQDVNKDYRLSLIITWILGLLNLSGYVVIVTFLGITEVPIIIRQTDERVADALANPSVREYRNPGAFTWWGVTLVFNIMFIIMHVANYPNNTNPSLYYFLVFGINFPWTLSCVRNYITVPNTPDTRIFVIIYDTILTKAFFRNHVLLMACSIVGFQSSPFFTLMLMDIVNNSSVLQDIVRSITTPALQLAIVFYTFVITVVIYAQFGIEYFEDWFVYDGDADDAESRGCHSVVSCFWLIFYHGVPAGSLEGVFDPIDNRGNNDGKFLQRVLFELSFFVWVGILLFNIITGLMVDTFSALREEAANRDDIHTNECFVCGFTRGAYDDVGITNGPSFDQHKDEEHYLWNYVYFFSYLRDKDPTDYNGVETYVSNMLADNNLVWIPSRTSFFIENQGAVVEDDDAALEDKMLEQVRVEVSTVNQEIAGVQRQLEELSSTMKSL